MFSFDFHSLKTRILLLLFILELTFASLIAYDNYSALSVIQKRIYVNTHNTLIMYQKQLDNRIKQTETYLYTLAINDNNIQDLIYMEEENTDWYKALYHLKTNMLSSLPIYTVNGIFCYFPSHDCYSPVTTDPQAYKIRDKLLPKIQNETVNLSDWHVVESDKQYFLCRIVHLNDIYIGAWISMEQLISSLTDDAEFSSRLHISSSTETVILDGEEPYTLTLSPRRGYVYTTLDDTEMLLVSQPLLNSPFILQMFVPTSEFHADNHTLISVIVFVFTGVLLFWLLAVLLVNRWVLKPMSLLTNAIRQLRTGDFDVRLPVTCGIPSEFHIAYTAFNDMVAQIKNLTIDVYERKLQKQRLEALYLKQQISPHFLINCLNTAYQLTTPNRLELARRMLKTFSRHLRYTLSSGSTVSLGEEITFVNNYLELSNIRYPDRVRLFTQCPDELYSATAIPLLLLNFIENTIKYEVSMDRLLEVHISAEAFVRENDQVMHLCIWDNGRGFSPDMLKRLENPKEYAMTENEHIGIANVILRAQHIYPYSHFSFHNRPDAGAQIDIIISLLPYQPNTP
ncbi:MAG: histidine kinase [Eubacteriales bacterium]|nr:histidine kinase [Eubacteriales bacterium]